MNVRRIQIHCAESVKSLTVDEATDPLAALFWLLLQKGKTLCRRK